MVTSPKYRKKILDGAKTKNHDVELLNLYDYDIKECVGCWKCAERGSCIFNDDFTIVSEKIKKEDAVVIASPIYWGNVTGRMKNFFDRHTGDVMKRPKNADSFRDLEFKEKLKIFFPVVKNIGPQDDFIGKKYIIVTACTLPKIIGRLKKDLTCTLQAMKIYTHKMGGRLSEKWSIQIRCLDSRKTKERSC